MNNKPLTQEEVVSMWMSRGIDDLFLAFKLDEPFSPHSPFLLAMGVEMICKAYLLGHEQSNYVNLSYGAGLAVVDKMAKCNFGHDLKATTQLIRQKSNGHEIDQLLQRDFDGFSGREFLRALMAAYLECRYPVPNPIHLQFSAKIGGKKLHKNILSSSGLEKFAFALSRQTLIYIRRDFSILASPDRLAKLRPKRTFIRFRRLFFGTERGLIARRRRQTTT